MNALDAVDLLDVLLLGAMLGLAFVFGWLIYEMRRR